MCPCVCVLALNETKRTRSLFFYFPTIANVDTSPRHTVTSKPSISSKKIYIYNFVITLLFSLSLFLSCPRCLLSLDWFRTSLNYYITRFIGDRKIGILFFPFFFPRLLDILKRWSRLHKNHFESSREMCHARPIKRYIGIVSRYTRFIDRNFGLASFPAHFRRYVRLLHGIKFLENRNVCVIFRGLSYRCKKQNFHLTSNFKSRDDNEFDFLFFSFEVSSTFSWEETTMKSFQFCRCKNLRT